jgi:hypothetical protein
VVSRVRWNFRAITVSPKMIPKRIKRKIFIIMPKLKESKLRGKI